MRAFMCTIGEQSVLQKDNASAQRLSANPMLVKAYLSDTYSNQLLSTCLTRISLYAGPACTCQPGETVTKRVSKTHPVPFVQSEEHCLYSDHPVIFNSSILLFTLYFTNNLLLILRTVL